MDRYLQVVDHTSKTPRVKNRGSNEDRVVTTSNGDDDYEHTHSNEETSEFSEVVSDVER